jgi:DNA recombination protein RmuC
MAESIGRFARQVTAQAASVAKIQNAQIDGFAQQLARLAESNERRLAEIRATLEDKLRELQTDNAARLEQMRATVDEKLHATLEQRLGESFRMVSDRLEQVHRGLGEMQALASDVGDLKRVLANVKTRGIWGEVQLSALLEQMLAPGQYAANVATVPGSTERVEYAIRLPGRDTAVWLPVDAKFPREDWERLQQAHDRADAAAADEAGRALETRIRTEARRIRDKYLAPPATTDFALMFLPIEGLYAEVVRRAGLVDELQREHRIVVAGPTTLCALLNSLQMGFRSLAVEQRTSEVWAVLGAVKTEFGKFGDVLAKTKQQLQSVSNSLDTAEVRSRAIVRKLRDVEELPAERAGVLLPDDDAPGR